MNATPEGHDEPRSENIKYELPDIDGGYDLIDHLDSLGFARNTGYGLAPIDYQEIKSWQNQQGLNLTPWEVETLFKLSSVYADMSTRAQDKKCPPPYEVEDDFDREKRIENLLFGK